MSNKLKVPMETCWIPGCHDDDGILMSEFLELTTPVAERRGVELNEHDSPGTIYEVADGGWHEASSGNGSRLAAVAYVEGAAGPAEILNSKHATAVAWRILCDTVLFAKAQDHGGGLSAASEAAMMIEFSSAIGAVRWAREVQRMITRPARTLKTDGLRLRVAIGIAEIVDEQDQLQLHCASNDPRTIKQFCRPGGIVLTGLAHDLVKPHDAWRDAEAELAEIEQADATATCDDDTRVYVLK